MSLHPQSNTITFEAALRDLAGGGDKARAAAAHALGDVTDADERIRAVKALLEVARDNRQEVRLEVALSLGDLEQEAAMPALVDLLDDGAPAVRQGAAIAMGKLGLHSGFAPLVDQLRAGPADLRFQAATSLVEIDAKLAYKPLAEAIASEADGEVLSAMALALGAIGDPRAAGHLAALLEHKRFRTQFDAAYALTVLDDRRGFDALCAGLDKADTAWDAVEAIERLGRAEDAAVLTTALTSRRLDVVAVRAAAAILQLRGNSKNTKDSDDTADSARTLLQRASDARKLEIMGLAVQVLSQCADIAWARSTLERARTSRRGRRLAEEIDLALANLSERAP